jgi:hypothetical protein
VYLAPHFLFLALALPQASQASASPEDSLRLRHEAEDLQSTFERRRRRLMPRVADSGYAPCQELIGRICLWHDSDDWLPEPDTSELIELRFRLVQGLDEIGRKIPGDPWVLGQRVFYRAEAGAWQSALRAAQRCGGAPDGWCDALQGFALNGLGEYERAERAFRRGLAEMDSVTAEEWTSLGRVADRNARGRLEDAAEAGDATLVDRFWRLADPLFLAPGNDRLTEHFARRVVEEIKSEASAPWGIRWGDDLAEVNARYGWERGWERSRPRPSSPGFEDVIGHQDSRGRAFVPPGEVLEDPTSVSPGEWTTTDDSPRTAYVPPYAPEFLSGVGQVAVFPREDSVLVVAATRVPPSEGKWEARADTMPGVPWPLATLLDMPSRIGAFLLAEDGSLEASAERSNTESGALIVRAAAGRYLISVEAWSPRAGRAGRLRHGLVSDTVAPDLATLSDLLLMDDGPWEIESLEEAAPTARTGSDLRVEEPVRVGWELTGLGWEPEAVEFSLSLYPAGEGFFGRIGRWLGFGGGREEPLRLTWVEPGPFETGPWFRSTRLELPTVEPGEYVLRLSVRLQGREELEMKRAVRITP